MWEGGREEEREGGREEPETGKKEEKSVERGKNGEREWQRENSQHVISVSKELFRIQCQHECQPTYMHMYCTHVSQTNSG